MSLFANIFKKVLNEDIGMTAGGVGSAFGPNAAGGTAGLFPGGSDSYAPGDARIPDLLGSKKKKRKPRKSSKSKKRARIRRRKLKKHM